MVFSILDKIISSGLRNSKSEGYISWNEIQSGEIDADLVINGSSIAAYQISPIKLDSILEINSYNLGRMGFLVFLKVVAFVIVLSDIKSFLNMDFNFLQTALHPL